MQVRFDKRTKNKVGKRLKTNVAMSPFFIVSILAAIAEVVWVIGFFLFHYI